MHADATEIHVPARDCNQESKHEPHTSAEKLAPGQISSPDSAHAHQCADCPHSFGVGAKEPNRRRHGLYIVAGRVDPWEVDGAIGGVFQNAQSLESILRLVVPGAKGQSVKVPEAQ